MNESPIIYMLQNIIFEEEDEITPPVLHLLLKTGIEKKQERHKIVGYFEEIIPRYLNDDFKAHFRLERSTIQYVIENLGNNINKTTGRMPLPLQKQLLLTIWYLANQEVFRAIADRFNVLKSTAWDIIYRIADLIIAIRKRFIKWPTQAEAVRTSHYFLLKSGIPNVLGCIDGSHIPILALKIRPDSYINRKGYHSVILQGICNEKLEFINVSCGWPGSMHDSRVLRCSDFNQILENRTEDIFYGNMHLLGDSAYSLSNYVLIPFRDNGRLSARQKKFNKKLSSVRIMIEHVFGVLKTRFRILKYVNIQNTVNIPKIVLTCCILDNICRQKNDLIDVDEDLSYIDDNDNRVFYCGKHDENVGVLKRNYIASIV